MQVRSVEFQENFRLVTLEASRQQSVVIREGNMANETASAALLAQRTEDLGRPLPTDESSETRVVDEGEGGTSRDRRQRRNEPESDEAGNRPAGGKSPRQGNSIDFLA